MHRHAFSRSAVLLWGLTAAVAAGACGREPEPTPVPEVQSQATQPSNQPMTVTGCLKVGETEDSYVLAAARTEGSAESATYLLVANPDTNLQEQLGQRVRVSGTMDARQTTAAQTLASPSNEERAEATSGTSATPTVQTRTEIEINRLLVDSVTPLGERCDE